MARRSIFEQPKIAPQQKGVTGIYVGVGGKKKRLITSYKHIRTVSPGNLTTKQKLARGIGLAIL